MTTTLPWHYTQRQVKVKKRRKEMELAHGSPCLQAIGLQSSPHITSKYFLVTKKKKKRKGGKAAEGVSSALVQPSPTLETTETHLASARPTGLLHPGCPGPHFLSQLTSHSAPGSLSSATLKASFLFLEHTRHAPASGPLYLVIPCYHCLDHVLQILDPQGSQPPLL